MSLKLGKKLARYSAEARLSWKTKESSNFIARDLNAIN